MYSKIIGTGSYLPQKILTNKDIEAVVDTTDDWIVSRSGIKQRHIAADSEMTSDLAEKASRSAIERSGLTCEDIDLIIVATTTPDMVFPSTACILQSKLDISECPAFDVQAVCSGFVYALNIADLFIKSGQAKNALIVGGSLFEDPQLERSNDLCSLRGWCWCSSRFWRGKARHIEDKFACQGDIE